MTRAEPAVRALPAVFGAEAVAPALLGLASLIVFALAAPQASRLLLELHLGAATATGHGFALGWLGAFALERADALGGYAAMATLSALGLFALVAFVYARARVRCGVALSLCAALFALWTAVDAARVGGIAPVWLWAAAFLYALERAPRRSAWLAPLIAVVWCNVSATGLLAPALALLVAFGRAAEARDLTAARPYWPLVAGAAAATVLTPLGFAFPMQAYAALHIDAQFGRILPIAPAVVAPHVFRATATLVVLAAAWLWAGRRRAADAPLVLGAFVLCFCDGAFVPLLGIVAGPAFAAAAAPSEARATALSRKEACAVGAIALVVAFAGLVALPRKPPETVGAARRAGDQASGALLQSIVAGGGTHVVFCSTVSWCDAAETVEGLRPFLDERVELASAATLDAQENIVRARAGWRATLRAAHIDAMLVPVDSSLAQIVPTMAGWKAAGASDGMRLFVREPGAK